MAPDPLAPLADRIYLSFVASERTASPEELLPACRAANPLGNVFVCPNLGEALARTEQEPFLVITGSLHFLGEAVELLRLAPTPTNGERGLNEYVAHPTH